MAEREKIDWNKGEVEWNRFLQVGAITSTHGIRGEVKSISDDRRSGAVSKSCKKVILDTGKRQIDMEIQSVRFF